MGGMAEIFRARTAQAGFEKKVCIKRVLPHYLEDEDFVTMFRDEARTAAKLQHANVVQVFDFGEVDDDSGTTLYLAMELVEGADLRRVADASRKKKIPFELGEVVQIGIDVCRGLHHAHSLQENGKTLGIVHRDISPHNIMVSRQGEVKVTDFGIAKAAERSTHTSTGIVKGKVAYMSPEQAEGKPFDHRLDQWALGVVLWELLCGERLFRGENDATILRKVMNVEVPRPTKVRAEVPDALEEIILRALQGDPEARFPNLRQMELALSRFLFSGVIDPATAEVRNVFPRIVDAAGGEPQARRTNVLPAPQPLPAPKTEQVEDLALPSTTSEKGDSAVFVSSSKLPASPGSSGSGPSSVSVSVSLMASSQSQPQSQPSPSPSPSSSLPTTMGDDPRLLEGAARDFAARNPGSQRNPAAREASSANPAANPPARESSRKNWSSTETALGDGLQLQLEADRVMKAADVDDGTPATRTLVPTSERLPAAPGPTPTSPTPLTTATPSPSPSRKPLFAAAGILAAGALAAVAIVVAGSGPDVPAPVAALPAPAVAPPPPVAPAPAPSVPTTPAAAPKTDPPKADPPKADPPKAEPPKADPPKADPPKEAKAAKAAPGSVYVDVPGSWAHVFIGKKQIGDTPTTLTLAPGKYNITLENPDAKKKRTFAITVVSGVKTQINEPL